MEEVPKDKAERKVWTRGWLTRRNGSTANRFRAKLIEELGDEAGKAVKTAEAFEVCEYGTQPSKEDLKRIFPW